MFGGADAATAIQTGQACSVSFADSAAPSQVGTTSFDTVQVTVTRTVTALVAQRRLSERADAIALTTGVLVVVALAVKLLVILGGRNDTSAGRLLARTSGFRACHDSVHVRSAVSDRWPPALA